MPKLANIDEVLVYKGTPDTAVRPLGDSLMGDERAIALRLFELNYHHGLPLSYWRQLSGGGIERITDEQGDSGPADPSDGVA